MITIMLNGGLGNQMFQYAFGRKLEIKYGLPKQLDLSFINRRDFGPNALYRSYELNIFNVEADLSTEISGVDIIIKEPSLLYNEEISNLYDHIDVNKNILIWGFWQSEKYFIEIEKHIKEELQFVNLIQFGREKLLLDEINRTNSVAVHVRRSDYLTSEIHMNYGIDYFREAVNYIHQFVQNPKFFIFSDDLSWCRQNLSFQGAIIVDEKYAANIAEIHLQLMSNCKYFIIPNSTFSWWAAWLGNYAGKLVVAPKKWFSNDFETDIICDRPEWKTIG